MKKQITISLAILAYALPQFAFAFGGGKPSPMPTSVPSEGEPAYCGWANLSKHEVPYVKDGLKRLRMFKFGSMTLVGLAVGNSKATATRSMSEEFTSAGASQNYCTWYLNEGNRDGEAWFNHFYVDRPEKDARKAAAYYRAKLEGVFQKNAINMASCARDYGYIALGCDGQKHRGPTVFGMLLSYSGCTPEHSAEIVNYMWGLNTVPEASRLEVIREAYKMGQEQPEGSAAIRAALSQ
jgi:hypothetical protein